MADAPKILETDSLRQSFPKLNSAIDNANEALKTANTAKSTADEAKEVSDRTRTEFNQITNNDTSALGGQLSVGAGGEIYSDAQDRFIKEYEKVSADLAQNEQHVVNKTKERKALVTFTDDDGAEAVLARLKPLAIKHKVPFVLAVPTGTTGNTGNLTWDELRDLQDNYGFEIASHSYSHVNLTTLTSEECYNDLKLSIDTAKPYGVDIKNMCIPFGAYNDGVLNEIRKLFNCARRSYGGNNYSPLETFSLRSVALGSFFDEKNEFGTGSATNTLQYYKDAVDDAIAKNGWVIFIMHCGNLEHDDTQQKHLDDLIAYIKTTTAEIVTMQQGIEKMGNLVDTGIYEREDNYKRKEHFVVGCTGKVSQTNKNELIELMPTSSIKNSTLPSELSKRKIYVNKVFAADADGLPESAAGMLVTKSLGVTSDVGYITQNYYVFNSKNIYTRYAIQDTDTWSDWELVNNAMKYMPANSNTNSTPITDFELQKTTINAVTGANSTGFPNNQAGTLTTYRPSTSHAFCFQEYQVYGSGQKWYRGHDGTNWLEWEPLFNVNKIMPPNSNLANRPITEFEMNRITINTVNNANADGFPNSKAGMLHTYRLSTDNGYNYQEYHVHATNEKWIRGHNGTSWLEWTQL